MFPKALLILMAALPSMAFAQTPEKLPPNTINCADWHRAPNGTWFSNRGARPFELGSAKNLNLSGSVIYPHSMQLGGYDITPILDAKCGKT
jgi:hypothetical protein